MAEHALVPHPDPTDAFGNTRTTLTSWWERMLVAPHNVGFHLEHHLVMTVPHYRLPRMHALLRDRGMLDDSCVDVGYWAVLKRAASKKTADAGDEAEPLTGPMRYPPF